MSRPPSPSTEDRTGQPPAVGEGPVQTLIHPWRASCIGVGVRTSGQAPESWL